MDFVKSYFGKNEPLTSSTLLSLVFFQISTDLQKKRGTKVFNCSEVHFYRSNFLQNLYFRTPHWTTLECYFHLYIPWFSLFFSQNILISVISPPFMMPLLFFRPTLLKWKLIEPCLSFLKLGHLTFWELFVEAPLKNQEL